MDLVREDKVEFEVAKANANNPSDFDLKINVFGSSSGGQGQGGSGVENQGVQQTGLAAEMRDMMNRD